MVKGIPKRGDLVYLNFSPQSGHEQAGHRPAIVLSPEAFNEKQKFALVCPITGKKKDYPFEVELPQGLAIKGIILTDQVRSVDWRSRKLKVVESAPDEVTNRCLDIMRTLL